MSMQLLGKRELKRLASVANDGAGAGYSGFAKGMMAKMGWAEGQGLGKDQQGRCTYVQVKKKDDNAGLGKEKAQQDKVNDQWYFDAFDSALANMGGKKKKKKKDKKSKAKKTGKPNSSGERESQEAETAEGMNMYDKMFMATGGARMGMRARASQNGKLARTEGSKDGAGDVPIVASNGSAKGEAVGTEDAPASTRHKRKREWAMVDKSSGQSGVDVVVLKGDTTAGEEKVAGSKEEQEQAQQETKGLESSDKAARKRCKSEAKRAKRARKTAQEEEVVADRNESGEDDAESGAAAEPGTVQAKARKKKKKKGKKDK